MAEIAKSASPFMGNMIVIYRSGVFPAIRLNETVQRDDTYDEREVLNTHAKEKNLKFLFVTTEGRSSMRFLEPAAPVAPIEGKTISDTNGRYGAIIQVSPI